MFAAYLQIVSKKLTDRYNDKAETEVIRLANFTEEIDRFPSHIKTAIRALQETTVEISAVSFVVNTVGGFDSVAERYSIVAKVITNNQLD